MNRTSQSKGQTPHELKNLLFFPTEPRPRRLVWLRTPTARGGWGWGGGGGEGSALSLGPSGKPEGRRTSGAPATIGEVRASGGRVLPPSRFSRGSEPEVHWGQGGSFRSLAGTFRHRLRHFFSNFALRFKVWVGREYGVASGSACVSVCLQRVVF